MKTKKLKRETKIIILSVLILTIVTMSVSYSAFFSVQSLSTIQEISTGNLDVNVTVDNTYSILNSETELFPVQTTEIEGGTYQNYSLLTLLNEGDLDADFSVTINYDYDAMRKVSGYENMTDTELRNYLVSLDYLNIGIYDDINGTWINFDSGNVTNYYPAISSLVASTEGAYPILRDTVSAKVTGTEQNQRRFKIYIWLNENTPTSEIGKFVYLKLNVKCAAGSETIEEVVKSIG